MEEEDGEGGYEPMVLDDYTFEGPVKRDPYADSALVEVEITPRDDDPGWIDCLLTASDTETLGHGDAHWTLRYYPTDDEDRKRVLLYGVIPIRVRA